MMRRFFSSIGSPPPVEITWLSPEAASTRLSRSSSLKKVSPLSANTSEIGLPARSTMRSSVSTNCHPRRLAAVLPTEVLPEPENPVMKMFFFKMRLRPAGPLQD